MTKAFNYTFAESLFVSAVDKTRSVEGKKTFHAAALNNLAFFYRVQQKFSEAESFYRRAITAFQSLSAPDSKRVALGLNNLAVMHHLCGDDSKADAVSSSALEFLKQTLGSESLEAADTLNNRSVFSLKQRKYPEAESLSRASLLVREKVLGPADAKVAQSLNNLALACERQGRYDEVLPLYQRSLDVFERSLDSEHPDIARVLWNFSAFLRTRGEYSEAERLLQWSLRITSANAKLAQDAALVEQLDRVLTVYLALWDCTEQEVVWPVPPIQEKSLTAENSESLVDYASSVRQLRAAVGSGQRSEEFKTTVKRLGPWYHNIQLTPDVSTNPDRKDYPGSRWRVLEPHVPADLRGKTVLDIGCNTGFFSVELKKRGADRVVGIDIMPHVLAQARFMTNWFDQPVELLELGAYDLPQLGTFDIVFFVGVLYHLKHPLYALEQVASVCRETLYVQTMVRGSGLDFEPAEDYPSDELAVFEQPAYPKLYFIEKSLNGDSSNWWMANYSCLKAMLRCAGFRSITPTESGEIFVCHK